MIVGVDGCRAGWVAVGERKGLLFVELWPTIEPLFTEAWDFGCVDIPIGFLNGKERRDCDLQARSLLGANRSSAFFAPPREFLGALEYEEVRRAGMSLQSFYLLPKIREVEERICPVTQQRIKEAHPELAFRSRTTEILDKKKTEPGRKQRQDLLLAIDSPFELEAFKSKFLRKDVALDDLLDAAILLEVAREWASGKGKSVGEQRDSRGLKMEICY